MAYKVVANGTENNGLSKASDREKSFMSTSQFSTPELSLTWDEFGT